MEAVPRGSVVAASERRRPSSATDEAADRVGGVVAGHRRGVGVTVVGDRAHVAVAALLRARLRGALAIGPDRLPDGDGDAEDQGEQRGEPRQLQRDAHADDRVVAGLVDRRDDRGVVDGGAGHAHELGLEVDVNRLHAGDIADLAGHGNHAMLATHAVNAVDQCHGSVLHVCGEYTA